MTESEWLDFFVHSILLTGEATATQNIQFSANLEVFGAFHPSDRRRIYTHTQYPGSKKIMKRFVTICKNSGGLKIAKLAIFWTKL